MNESYANICIVNESIFIRSGSFCSKPRLTSNFPNLNYSIRKKDIFRHILECTLWKLYICTDSIGIYFAYVTLGHYWLKCNIKVTKNTIFMNWFNKMCYNTILQYNNLFQRKLKDSTHNLCCGYSHHQAQTKNNRTVKISWNELVWPYIHSLNITSILSLNIFLIKLVWMLTDKYVAYIVTVKIAWIT